MRADRLSLDRLPHQRQRLGCVVEFASWPYRVVPRNHQPEAIALVAWNHMEMHVEDLLPCCGTVCEEEVDSLAAEIRVTQRSRRTVPDSEQLRTVFNIQVVEIGRVTTRHDEHVPTHDGLDVHECHGSLVLVDNADLGLSGRDATEKASGHRARSYEELGAASSIPLPSPSRGARAVGAWSRVAPGSSGTLPLAKRLGTGAREAVTKLSLSVSRRPRLADVFRSLPVSGQPREHPSKRVNDRGRCLRRRRSGLSRFVRTKSDEPVSRRLLLVSHGAEGSASSGRVGWRERVAAALRRDHTQSPCAASPPLAKHLDVGACSRGGPYRRLVVLHLSGCPSSRTDLSAGVVTSEAASFVGTRPFPRWARRSQLKAARSRRHGS